jgi:hypothetical protein
MGTDRANPEKTNVIKVAYRSCFLSGIVQFEEKSQGVTQCRACFVPLPSAEEGVHQMTQLLWPSNHKLYQKKTSGKLKNVTSHGRDDVRGRNDCY